MVGGLPGELARAGVAVPRTQVAPKKQTVQRANRQDRREGVDQAPGAGKARRLQVARAERSPAVVKSAPEHDLRSMVQATKRVAREEALELERTLGTRESEMEIVQDHGAHVLLESNARARLQGAALLARTDGEI